MTSSGDRSPTLIPLAESVEINDVPGPVSNVDSYGNSKLHFAIKSSNLLEVRRLLSMGASVDHVDPEGNTSLLIAIFREDLDIIKNLLRYGANANIHSKDGKAPLHLCLLRPLMVTGIVESLLKANAYPSKTDKDGNTALHLIFQGRCIPEKPAEDVVRLLLSYGADVNALNLAGESPLHVMLKLFPEDTLEIYLPLLADHNADLKSVDSKSRSAFQLFVDRVHSYTPEIFPSRLSSWVGWVDIFHLFISHDAVGHASVDGEHLLLVLLRVSDELGHLDRIISNLCRIVSQNGRYFPYPPKNILHALITSSHFNKSQKSMEKYVQVSLEHGANPDELDENGDGILHTIARLSLNPKISTTSVRLVKVLLEKGAHPMLRNSRGELPVHRAYRSFKLVSEMTDSAAEECLKQIMCMLLERWAVTPGEDLSESHDEMVWWNNYKTRYSELNVLGGPYNYLTFLRKPVPQLFPEDIEEFPRFLAQQYASKKLDLLIARFRSSQKDVRAEWSRQIVELLRYCKSLRIHVDRSYYQFLLELFD